MKKRILITAGSTREAIDEVMTIDNMSTGSIGINLAEKFLAEGHEVVLVGNYRLPQTKLYTRIEGADWLTFVSITSCDDMLVAIEEQSLSGQVDAIIHASAVGDYKTDYTFLIEDMAAHIGQMVASRSLSDAGAIEEAILALMADPDFKISNDSKISSNQPNLTVKLGLTTKVISRLRAMFPDTFIVGFKLLENVPKQELYDYAQNLCRKNNIDCIMANDLAELRSGAEARYLVDKNGFTGRILETPEDMFKAITELAGI